jgi:hypothetical protein
MRASKIDFATFLSLRYPEIPCLFFVSLRTPVKFSILGSATEWVAFKSGGREGDFLERGEFLQVVGFHRRRGRDGGE